MLRRALALATVSILSVLTSTGAFATAQRTFVASNGNDANPCSIAQPCRGFARAMTQTSSSGEVIVLDSAGYGVVTITQSVSIIAPAGVYAGVSVFTGNGITINGPSIKVTLRGLTINGQGGATGILLQQGSELHIEDCTIAGMGDNGIDVRAASSTTHVSNSVAKSAVNSGIYADALSGPVTLAVHGTRLEGNQWGLYARQGAQATVSESVIANNGTGIFVNLDNPGASSAGEVVIDSSTISANGLGISVQQNVAVASFYAEAAASRTTFAQNVLTAAATSAAGNKALIRMVGVELGNATISLLSGASYLTLESSSAHRLIANCSGGGGVFTNGNNQVGVVGGSCAPPTDNPVY